MTKIKLVSVKTIERLFKYCFVNDYFLLNPNDVITWACFAVEIDNKKLSYYKLPANKEDRTENVDRLFNVLMNKWMEWHKQ